MADLEELWRRIAFSVAVNNTDDHLRNHGFVREGAGWTLSPVFDVNPNPDVAAGRVTSISYAVSRGDATMAVTDAARYFGLTADRAAAISAEIHAVVSGWRQTARSNGITESDLRRFAPVLDTSS